MPDMRRELELTKAKGDTGFFMLTKGRLTTTIGWAEHDINRPSGYSSERERHVIELLKEARKLMDELTLEEVNFYLADFEGTCRSCPNVVAHQDVCPKCGIQIDRKAKQRLKAEMESASA